MKPPRAAITFRPYTDADFAAVCAIHDAARPRELAGSTDPRAFRPMAEEAEDEEFFESTTLLACLADSRVVGFVSSRDAYITWLYVHPEFHRHGVGRQLLAEALKHCGADAWVNTMAGNEAALALYRAAGFEVVKSFPSECDGYPCMCVRLALPSSYMRDPNARRRDAT